MCNQFFFPFFILAVIFSAACQTKKTSDAPKKLLVVNAPADGTISRILISESAKVEAVAGILEIEIPGAVGNAPAADDWRHRSETALMVTQQELENAGREVKRTAIEMQRVEPLVSFNQVPQAQLDAARADLNKAEGQLEQWRKREKVSRLMF